MRASPMMFEKYQGCGNDFLFFDCRNVDPSMRATLFASGADGLAKVRAHAKRVCDRHFGLGADGVVYILASSHSGANVAESTTDLTWYFLNSDGSDAGMCGNAARCAAAWSSKNLNINKINLHATAGIFELSVDFATGSEELGWANGQKIYSVQTRIPVAPALAVTRRHERGFLLNTGVPHIVIEAPAALSQILDPDIQIRAWMISQAQIWRYDSFAGGEGANVTFWSRHEEGKIHSVTFERGVEDFTLACGTGVLAAALASADASISNDKIVSVRTLGGGLQVHLDATRRPRLVGPAKQVASGLLVEELSL